MISADLVLSSYQNLIDEGFVNNKNDIMKKMIPKFDKDVLTNLCDESINVLSKGSTLVKCEGDYVTVGDLHGNIFDLLRILNICRLPPATKYMFLGDYVDRGSFSIEVITLILALHCLYPKDVVVLRGNHEFEDTTTFYGFKDEVIKEYKNEELYMKFITVFGYLPLAAVANKAFFCVHGGISQNLNYVEQIEQIKRPIFDTKKPIINDLLWADPINDMVYFTDSQRGLGTNFGLAASKHFLEKNKLKCIIRGHQCIKKGVEFMGNGSILTVFSASNYNPLEENISAVALINTKGETIIKRFDPIPRIARDDVSFFFMNQKPKFLVEGVPIVRCMTGLLESKRRNSQIFFMKKAIKSPPPRAYMKPLSFIEEI